MTRAEEELERINEQLRRELDQSCQGKRMDQVAFSAVVCFACFVCFAGAVALVIAAWLWRVW